MADQSGSYQSGTGSPKPQVETESDPMAARMAKRVDSDKFKQFNSGFNPDKTAGQPDAMHRRMMNLIGSSS